MRVGISSTCFPKPPIPEWDESVVTKMLCLSSVILICVKGNGWKVSFYFVKMKKRFKGIHTLVKFTVLNNTP
jgi:hypothetical protein